MVQIYSPHWTRRHTFHTGVWLVFGIGVVASSATVSTQKHPHAYTEQIANSTFPGHPTSWTQESVMGGEESDGVTEGMDLNTTLQPDLYDNSSDGDRRSNLTEEGNTSVVSSEGLKMVSLSPVPSQSPITTIPILVAISLLALIVLLLIIGGVSYVVYSRHLLWNRPQALSDKCSADESTGYIDDTFRENSEEMYSLDNDSFLNSLEAMTIQNYWTDHVKHTKL